MIDLTEVLGLGLLLALVAAWVLREQTSLLGRVRSARLYTAVTLGELGARPVVGIVAQINAQSAQLWLYLALAQILASALEAALLRWIARLPWPRAAKLAAGLALLNTLLLLALLYRAQR